MPDSKAPIGWRPSKERRKEPRFESKGLADLVIVNPPKLDRLTARVINVSRYGFQIDLDGPVEKDSKVELRLKEVIVCGVVTNCAPAGAGRFHAGIRTVEITDSPLAARHISKMDLQLFTRGNSLSEAQREQYEGHLALCAACKKKAGKPGRPAAKTVAPKRRSVRKRA